MPARIIIEIAPYLRGTQQPVNALGFVKAFIDAKADVRRKFEIYAPGNFRAKMTFVAVQGRQHGCIVLAAEWKDVHGRNPQVWRHTNFRDGDEMGFDHRIVHLAARQDLGHCMADEFAGPQRTLGWPALCGASGRPLGGLTGMTARHCC